MAMALHYQRSDTKQIYVTTTFHTHLLITKLRYKLYLQIRANKDLENLRIDFFA